MFPHVPGKEKRVGNCCCRVEVGIDCFPGCSIFPNHRCANDRWTVSRHPQSDCQLLVKALRATVTENYPIACGLYPETRLSLHCGCWRLFSRIRRKNRPRVLIYVTGRWCLTTETGYALGSVCVLLHRYG